MICLNYNYTGGVATVAMDIHRDHDSLFSRVLIPTDGTSASRCAVRGGVELAATHEAEIHALYVVETELSMGHVDFEMERQEKQGEAAVETVAQRAQTEGVPVTKAFRYGRTHREILDYATEHDTDIVVMGTHGRSGFARIKAAGSVAEQVVRDASVPVMVLGGDACMSSSTGIT